MELLRELTIDEKVKLTEWLELCDIDIAWMECPFNNNLRVCNYCRKLIKDYPESSLCPCDLFGVEDMREFAKEVLNRWKLGMDLELRRLYDKYEEALEWYKKNIYDGHSFNYHNDLTVFEDYERAKDEVIGYLNGV